MNKINALQQQGLNYKLEEKYEEALIAISEIFEMEYYSNELMYELAEIYYLKGDMKRAEVWSKKVISFDKKHAAAYLILAKTYSKQNDVVQLLPVLNKLLGNAFANIKNQVENLLNTIALFDYESEIEKNYPNIYKYIVKKEQSVEKSMTKEEVVVEKKVQGAETTLSNLKKLLQGLEDEKKQESTLSEIISNAFKNGLTKEVTEKIYAEAIDKVIAEISNCAETDKHKVDLLNVIAVKFYEDHCLDKVLPILVKALEIDGQNDTSLKNLGVVLFNIGEKDLALQYLNQVSAKDIAVIDFINSIKE
jgi:tetratricopeptide (TPR) repeat protein